MLCVNSHTPVWLKEKLFSDTRNNGVLISREKPVVYSNASKPCITSDLLFLSLYLLDSFYGEFSSLGIWLIKSYFGLRPSSLQTALWDIT